MSTSPRNTKVWMIVDKTSCLLPVAIFDTLSEACADLCVPIETVKSAFKRHGYYKGKHFDIIRVQIDE